jgi:hypothetical protein
MKRNRLWEAIVLEVFIKPLELLTELLALTGQ